MAEVRGALVLAAAPGALEIVAGLPLVVRAVLTLRAAGFAEVVVFGGPQARRVTAVLAARCPETPCLASVEEADGRAWPDLVLVVAGDVLFDGEALAPLLAAADPATVRVGVGPGAAGGETRFVVGPGGAMPLLLAEVSKRAALRTDALRRLGAADEAAIRLDRGLLLPLTPTRPAPALEAALLDHLGRRTPGDSYLAPLIDRRLSRPVTRLILDTPVTPSKVTLASLVVGVLGAAGLASGSYAGRLAGVLALVVSLVLDCVDGELARARFQQSAAGARLDLVGDYVVNLAVFVGLGVGLARQGLPAAGVWAAVLLVAGVVTAMAGVHVLFIRPALTRGGDLHWAGDADSLRGTPLAAVVEKLASRDYTYLLLVFALLGHLEWFVYAAAVGAWAFVVALVGYRSYVKLAPRRAVTS